MKQIISILSLFLVLSGIVVGQEADTTSVKAEMEDEEEGIPHLDLMLIDLNWDYPIGNNKSFKQDWYGRGANVSILYDHPFQEDGMVSGAFGVGIAAHNYYSNSVVTRFDTALVSTSDFVDIPDSLMKSIKLSVNYVDIPIELRFRSAVDDRGNRIKVAIGAKVGYRLQTHEKTIDAQNVKLKTFAYPHITKWRYGATFRAGYGSVMFHGFYSISTLFEEQNTVTPYNALQLGVTITPF